MKYSELRQALDLVNPNIKMWFDESCHIQYTFQLIPKSKPICQCYCDKVIVDGKYTSIDPYMMEISLDEMRKYIDQM